MGKTTSDIFETMANVSKVLDRMVLPEPMSELDALALNDTLLGTLRKAYLDARGARKAAESEYGYDDGMTEMAMLVEDSAWCAMQTRYLEVRDEKGAAERAARAIALDQRRKQNEQECAEREEKMRLYRFLDMLRAQARHANEGDSMMLFVLAMAMLSRGMRDNVLPMPSNASMRFNLSAA